MKKHFCILALLIISIFTSCSNKSIETGAGNKDTVTVQKDSVSSSANQCPRGIPAPIADSSVFKEHEFYLKNQIGYESFISEKGDKVQVTNSGCEYYMLSFRIETSRYKGDIKDVRSWYKVSADLLDEMRKDIKVSFDMKKGIKALRDQEKNENRDALKEEIDFGGEDIRSYVSLDNVEKGRDDKYVVEVTFGIGPL